MRGRTAMECLRLLIHRHETRYVVPLFKLLDSKTQQLVVEDAQRYPAFNGQDGAETRIIDGLRELLYTNNKFRSLFYYRCAGCMGFGMKGKALLKLCSRALPANPSIEICAKSLGGGLLLNHASIVIGDAVIGKNVTVGAGVIIGKHHGGAPVIHDNVTICANAVVMGPIDVGENSIVGAGAVVLHDVPANTVVAGVPAKVLHER